MKSFLKNILFTEGDSIVNICAPLKLLGIEHFCYYKVYSDGTIIDFATHLAWTEFFYNKIYNLKYNPLEIVDHFYVQDGISLWEMNPHNKIWQDGKEYFNVGNGITLSLEKNEIFSETCCFWTHRDNYQINNFYLNNLDLLKIFVTYFKEKARHLLERAKTDRLTIPKIAEVEGTNFTIKNNRDLDLQNQNQLHKQFIATLYPKKSNSINMDEDSTNLSKLLITSIDPSLTPQQAKCVELLLSGKSVKCVSAKLNLSPRTVEHYLATVRKKYHCRNVKELIAYYLENRLGVKF
jgi:DNA-binding CsgD family transcriptional regulator